MSYRMSLVLGLALTAIGSGCNSGRVVEQDIPVNAANDPLYEPRSILEQYSKGQAPGSEVMGFPAMIAKVRETDPKTAEMLEAGFNDIQKASKAERIAKSKDLLSKIQPRAYPTE